MGADSAWRCQHAPQPEDCINQGSPVDSRVKLEHPMVVINAIHMLRFSCLQFHLI